MRVIQAKSVSDKIRKVKKIIESSGNLMGSVWFIKRSNGKRRKMSYRLHVRKPTYAKIPKSNNAYKRKLQDAKNMLITVFDVNAVRYNRKGKMSGRGEWKSIPLDGVTRICVNGEIYKIN